MLPPGVNIIWRFIIKALLFERIQAAELGFMAGWNTSNTSTCCDAYSPLRQPHSSGERHGGYADMEGGLGFHTTLFIIAPSSICEKITVVSARFKYTLNQC
jgi:hypothetical protein